MNKNPLSEPLKGEFGFLFIDKRRSKIRKSTYLRQNDDAWFQIQKLLSQIDKR
jgi:hypothetical protein